MNLKGFFVTTLQTALDLQIATPDDILKHVTPDVLAEVLPRPLWARLLTACLGAPRVDATLVIETVGVPNLCEHVPAPLIWACIADIASRSLGRESTDEPIVLRPKATTMPPPPPQPSSSRSTPLTAPPPDVIARPPSPLASVPRGPSIPTPTATPAGTGTTSLNDIVAELEADAAREERISSAPPSRVRTPTQSRFRQSQTAGGVGRLAQNSARRPQAAAMTPTAPTMTPTPSRGARRGETEVEEAETETAVAKTGGEDWRSSLAVEDEQLVDWQSAEETVTTADDIGDRKR